MEIVITALKAAVIEANTRARILLSSGQASAAEATYETLLSVLNNLLAADEDHLRGWQYTASIVSDLRQQIAIDALVVERLSELQIRTAALLDLPELMAITSLDDIYETITATINVGAPRYNAGDVRGCCTIYWATIHAMASAPAMRGFPGYARALGQLRAIVEAPPPQIPFDAAGIDDFAWALRHTLDAVLKITG